MKYILLIHSGKHGWISAEREQSYEESTQFTRRLKANGQRRAANPLQSVTTATIVRARDHKRLVTDGPFAETHEQLGG
jgi:hypothetical protein